MDDGVNDTAAGDASCERSAGHIRKLEEDLNQCEATCINH